MKLDQIPVSSAPEMFERIRAISPTAGTGADHVCVACKSAVLLRYGRHQNKYAVSGRPQCPWCWSQSWYESTEAAWAAFERQQRRYEQERAVKESLQNNSERLSISGDGKTS